MPYKQFYNHLFEGRNSDLAKAILDKADRTDAYDTLDTLDSTPTKKHLPTLAKFYIETSNFDVLQDYYKRFSASNLKGKDISQFKDFHEFELAVDAASSSIESGESIEVSGHPIYNDNKVDVFKGDSQKACVQYGKGYGFCISNKQIASNLFYTYRFKEGAKLTAYFVRFKDRSSEIKDNKFVDPLHLIVLHVGNGTMLMTGADNGSQEHGTKPIKQEELLQEFPELKSAFAKNVFVSDEYNELEQDVINYIHNKNITVENFITFPARIKTAYISTGKRLTNEMWDVCNEDQRLFYVNVGGGHDLTEHQKETVKDDAKFMQNYWRVIKTKIDVKQEYFTTDEIQYIEDNKYIPANISGGGVRDLLDRTQNKQQMAAILGQEKINTLDDYNIRSLLYNNSSNKREMAAILGQTNINKLSGNNVYYLLKLAANTKEMAAILGKVNINKLNDDSVAYLLKELPNNQEIIDIIVHYKGDNLTQHNTFRLLYYSLDKQKLVAKLGQENINRLPNYAIWNLLNDAQDKQEIATVLGPTLITKLTSIEISSLLDNAQNKQEMAAALGKANINKLLHLDIRKLLNQASNKQDMIDAILTYKTLTPDNIFTVLSYSPNKQDTVNKLDKLGYNRPVAENKITYKQFYTNL